MNGVTEIWRKKVELGKVALCGGRRINAADVEAELRLRGGAYEFSASGEVWNGSHTDIVMGGQCLDDMKRMRFRKNGGEFDRIYAWWKVWHLNAMHAGTEAQEKALAAAADGLGHYPGYDEAIGILRDAGLYDDRGHRYGSSWLTREIPSETVAEMKAMLSEHLILKA